MPVQSSEKTLLFIGVCSLRKMLAKGNVWYVRHYECYFDKVFVAYLFGSRHEPVESGATTLVSLSSGNTLYDLVLAPWRLYHLARKIHPTSFLTADLVYSWWTCVLLRLLLHAKIQLLPLCMPELIYQNTGKSMSLMLPISVERIFIILSYAAASKIVAARCFGTLLVSLTVHERKLVVVDLVVEALPSPEFFKALKRLRDAA